MLGYGSTELPHIAAVFKEICAIESPDGVAFRPDTVHAAEICKQANDAGVRVMFLGVVDGARCQIQIDIGFSDAGTPGPEDVEYPVILPEFAAPKLRVYPPYTVVAEKLEALSSLGIANSRMKDYFDLWILAQHTDCDADTLRRAVQATFNRRKTALPGHIPFGLTDALAQDAQKQAQWQAFLGKNRLEALALNEVIAGLATLMLPVIKAAHANAVYSARWPAGGPWLTNDAGVHESFILKLIAFGLTTFWQKFHFFSGLSDDLLVHHVPEADCASR